MSHSESLSAFNFLGKEIVGLQLEAGDNMIIGLFLDYLHTLQCLDRDGWIRHHIYPMSPVKPRM